MMPHQVAKSHKSDLSNEVLCGSILPEFHEIRKAKFESKKSPVF